MGKEDAILNERMSGVIIPPPETRKIIDKAAELVAKYGSSIEATLKNDEKNLPKFSFLDMDDPYRAYYTQRVNDLVKIGIENIKNNDENKLLGKKMENGQSLTNSQSNINSINSSQRNSSIQNELRKMIEDKRIEKLTLSELKPPAQDQFSISHPNISSLEMDIIKVTAQFVARNGQRFLSGLLERETKNPQFDFLKPHHSLFGYFTYLVESYAKCLRKEGLNKIELYINDRDSIMKRGRERYLWEKRSKETQKRKEAIDEQERNQMSQIDWYDFAIVEVIDFTEEELYDTVPIMNTIESVVNANISSLEGNINSLLKMNNINLPVEVNQSEIIPEIIPQENITVKHQIIEEEILPEPGMKIVKNYVRKTEKEIIKKDSVKCPLCKEFVTIDDWPKHIKIELLDPKWKEIQKELQERKLDVNLAPTNDFLGYLSDFSKYRPDLFGDIKDVAKVEEKKKVEAKLPSTIWDGYAPNMTRTSANIAMLIQQNKKNIEESKKGEVGSNVNTNVNIDQDNFEFRGLSGNRNVNDNFISIGVTHQSAQITNKNITESKINITNQNEIEITNSNQLIPEDVFIKKNPKPFKLNVKIPENTSHPNLKGQIINIKVEPQDIFINIKALILTILSINLEKLNDFFLKTFNSLIIEENRTAAFYNLQNGGIIELNLI